MAAIESKLSLLGERFRDAREDASHLRTNLEGVLEKLDAKTRRHFEGQIALARRLTAINSLTGRVAHEIKNPLNSIALRLEMLRSQAAGEGSETESEIAILSEEVTRLDRVVRTFLDFNRPVEMAPRGRRPGRAGGGNRAPAGTGGGARRHPHPLRAPVRRRGGACETRACCARPC